MLKGKLRIVVRVVLALLGAIVLAFVAFFLAQPSRLAVERSIVVAAPQAEVFALIGDFHGWRRWSPWDQRDPKMKRTFGGPASGKGATYSWSGERSGEANLTIVDAKDGERVVIRYDLLQPFVATVDNTFVLAPSGGGTKVSWTVEMDNTSTMKVVSIFKSMADVLQRDVDFGLSNLKTAAENPGAAEAAEAAAPEGSTAASAAPPAPSAPASP